MDSALEDSFAGCLVDDVLIRFTILHNSFTVFSHQFANLFLMKQIKPRSKELSERREEMRSIKTAMKMLVSILKESQLYMTMTHEEKIALLHRLLKEYPYLGNSQN